MGLLLVPLAVFCLVSVTLWLVADHLRGPRHRVHERLDALERHSQAADTQRGWFSRVSSALAELVDKASPQLAKPLEPTNLKGAGRLRMRLSYAGLRSEHAKTVSLAAKVVCLAAGFFLGGGAILFTGDYSGIAMLRVIFYSGGGLFLPKDVSLAQPEMMVNDR